MAACKERFMPTMILDAVPTPTYAPPSMCAQCNAGHFSARPGPGKRVFKLLKSARPIAAIRTGLSLLRARCTAKSRIKAMRMWSERMIRDASPGHDAPAAARNGGDGAYAPAARKQSLYALATAGLSREIRPDVFHALAQRYCRQADTAHLYALHAALRHGGAGLHCPHEDPWASDAVGMAKHVLSTAVATELAQRSAHFAGRQGSAGIGAASGSEDPARRLRSSSSGNGGSTSSGRGSFGSPDSPGSPGSLDSRSSRSRRGRGSEDSSRGMSSEDSSRGMSSEDGSRRISSEDGSRSRSSEDRGRGKSGDGGRDSSGVGSASSRSFERLRDADFFASIESFDTFASIESSASLASIGRSHSLASMGSSDSLASIASIESIESIGSLASVATAARSVASSGTDGAVSSPNDDGMETLQAALAKAFVRFTAGVHGTRDTETATDWLQKAVEGLSDAQLCALGGLRRCLVHAQDGARSFASETGRIMPPNPLDRFIDELDVRVMACAKSRLDAMVRNVRHGVAVWRNEGLSPRGAAHWARERLSEGLRVRHYEAIASEFAHDRLLPELLARSLAADAWPDEQAFVFDLDAATLAQIQTGLGHLAGSDEGRALLARYPGFAHAVHQECRLRPPSLPEVLDARRQALRASVAAGDRYGAAQALRDLALQVRPSSDEASALQDVLPRDAFHALRETVDQALATLFRDPSNPSGPLNAATLSRLSNEEIEMLRHAEDLAPFGFAVSATALAAVWRERSRPHRQVAVAHAKALLDVLARPGADARDAMRPLYDCARAASRTWQMQVQIQAAGLDDWADIAESIMAEAIRQADEARGDSAHAELARAASQMAWSADALSSIASSINEEFEDEDLAPERNPAYRTGSSMRAAAFLGTALALQLDERRTQGPTVAPPAGMAADPVPTPAWKASFRDAVGELFGVVCDGDCREGRMAMGPEQYKIFERCLTEPIPIKRIVPVTIDVGTGPDTAQRVIDVDRQFADDAIERSSTWFSVSGVDREGRPVAYATSGRAPSENTHVAGIKRGLLALHCLAGPDTAHLSNYMTQTPGAGFMVALMVCADRSPIRLPDGRVAMPGGDGDMQVDIMRHADGSYRLATTIAISKMRTCAVFDEDGRAEGMKLDPAKSYASLSYETRLRFSADGTHTIEMTAPVTLQYRLVPVS
jgi:hypothetical protein